MFSETVIVSVQGVGKAYYLYDNPQDRLKHMFTRRLGRHYGREFWALQNVTFDLRRGEVMGIIGKNGSGKSTLLQILAGVLTPTRGAVHVNGRVGALLELGSGFNPEYTGRENIRLNAALLGIPLHVLDEKIQSIIEFADIGEFIDQPIKVYSSGMLVRLAFAVSTGLDVDVLLIDEALAVGDVFFRQKCYQRLNELREKGTAIVLVTHNMLEVEQFCDRALLLDHGQPVFYGDAVEAVKWYYLLEQEGRGEQRNKPLQATMPPSMPITEPLKNPDPFWPEKDAFMNITGLTQISNGQAHCSGVAVCDESGHPRLSFSCGERAVFFYEFTIEETLDAPIGGVVLFDDKGIIVHGKNSLQFEIAEIPRSLPAGSKVRFRQEIKLDLKAGEYTFEVGLATIPWEEYQRRRKYHPEELRLHFRRICHVPNLGPLSVSLPEENGVPYTTHIGIANLDGKIEVYLV